MTTTIRPFLIGPASAESARRHLPARFACGSCRTFEWTGSDVIPLSNAANWAELCDLCPISWRPSYLVVQLCERDLPAWLWGVPVPLVGLAPDWKRNWHLYRRLAPRCELIFIESSGLDRLIAEGVSNARSATLLDWNLAGESSGAADVPADRDVDIVFVVDLSSAASDEDQNWLLRIAALTEHWTIKVRDARCVDSSLLRRAKIVLSRASGDAAMAWAHTAISAGALFFQTEHNSQLRDGHECVVYNDRNAEELLRHWLSDDRGRIQAVQALHSLSHELTFEKLWETEIERCIEVEWDAMVAKRALKMLEGPTDNQGETGNLRSIQELYWIVHDRESTEPLRASQEYRQLATQQSGLWLSRLNCLDLASANGRINEARESIEGLFESLSAPDSFSLVHLKIQPSRSAPLEFRLAWEAAAWMHPGKPNQELEAKRTLIIKRAHQFRGELTDSLEDRFCAAAIWPTLTSAIRELGVSLLRHHRPHRATTFLRMAWERQPLDLNIARTYHDALLECRDARGARRLQRSMRQLGACADLKTEEWFAQTVPVGDELVSIIIPCWNQFEFTRQCLESVFRCTQAQFELILIDNGSTDETPRYFDVIAQQSLEVPNARRVEIIRNDGNRGFAAACNQGLAVSKGDYLVLLNNDTIVTQNWLERLVDWSLVNYPKIGLVGPVSNCAPPAQLVEYELKDVTSLEVFASSRHCQFADSGMVVERLTGFCLLLRRDVLEQIGNLDERYGWGFFEDDDWCQRAIVAGYELLLAQNVFIHHFGSRTVKNLDISDLDLLRENHGKFREKWGDDIADRYSFPSAKPIEQLPKGHPSSRLGQRPRVSLCMIVRNEEANLDDCLRSVSDLVDEIIIVDTGSTDATKEIASRYTDRVFDFPWIDSFAAARNESLRHATCEWVFWMDADDRVDEDNRIRLRQFFERLDGLFGYVMKCVCVPDAETGAVTAVDHVRVFRNHPEVRWKYRIHEQILPAIRAQGGDVAWTDVAIHHIGYQDASVRAGKRERDLRLLRLEDRDNPDDPFTLFNLGMVAMETHGDDEALRCLRRSLDLSHPRDSIVRKIYALIAQIHRQRGRVGEALATCREGREHYPDDPEILFQEAISHQEVGRSDLAAECYRQILRPTNTDFFASTDVGVRGYKSHHNLAMIYRDQANFAAAERHLRLAIAESPAFLPSTLALGDLYVKQQRWTDLDQVIQQLRQGQPHSVDADIFVGRRLLVQKDYVRAREVFETVLMNAPKHFFALVYLSHVLLEQGVDNHATERVLSEILDLAPDNREAAHNLAVLRQGRPEKTG